MAMKHYGIQDSLELYGVREWGYGYFGINSKGHLEVFPTRDENLSCDLHDVVTQLRKKGVQTPLVLRFPQILSSRVTELNEAFRKAMKAYDYEGDYQGVFPVKTNQVKEVVDQVAKAGYKYRYGLEAGSKPELMIALSMNLHEDAMVLCNGYKDETFIRMALLARKAGRNVLITVEKMTELPLILKVAKELKVDPLLGLRFKLAAMGSGKWEGSAGDHAKFGLNTREILDAVEVLEKRGMLDDDERRIMERHTEYGARILDGSRLPVLRLASEIARTHHERFDGSGYPHGLKGRQIPLSGRIVAVVDVFDALAMDRAYRNAMPVEHALETIRAGRGNQFDPDVVDAFFSVAHDVLALREMINRGERPDLGAQLVSEIHGNPLGFYDWPLHASPAPFRAPAYT